MFNLKDGDLLIIFGSKQCQVYMEDESFSFSEPQHYGVIRTETKLETVKQYLIYLMSRMVVDNTRGGICCA